MKTAAQTLVALAQRFDGIARATQGKTRTAATRDAAQLRRIAELTIRGTFTPADAWVWADAAAGQLINDHHQLAKKARRG